MASLPPGYSPTLFDKVAALSHEAYNKLLGTVNESMAGRKVLAAMVMKTGPHDDGTVISLGTGGQNYFIFWMLRLKFNHKLMSEKSPQNYH